MIITIYVKKCGLSAMHKIEHIKFVIIKVDDIECFKTQPMCPLQMHKRSISDARIWISKETCSRDKSQWVAGPTKSACIQCVTVDNSNWCFGWFPSWQCHLHHQRQESRTSWVMPQASQELWFVWLCWLEHSSWWRKSWTNASWGTSWSSSGRSHRFGVSTWFSSTCC